MPVSKFTEDEVTKLKELLKTQDRVYWFWATVRTWALWLSAIFSAVHYGWDALLKVISHFNN